MAAFEDAIIDARLAPTAFGRRHHARRRVTAGFLLASASAASAASSSIPACRCCAAVKLQLSCKGSTRENPRHRRRRLHRLDRLAAPAGARRRSRRPRQPERLLRSQPEGKPPGAADRRTPGFRFVKLDVADRAGMEQLFAAEKFDRVIHLAAQAGVRYSLQNPHAYVESNVVGFINILEGCRHNKVAAPGLRVQLQRLRRQHQDAVLRARQRRPPGQPVRGHQEGQRADGAHLQPPLRPADHRPALLHRLRPVGPAGHGAFPVHQGHPRRAADRRLQPRQHAARLHLHRRHRRRRRPRARQACCGQPGI